MATAKTFSAMTTAIKHTATALCDDRLVLVHEGGYSEVYVPFCGHATIAALAESSIVTFGSFADTFAQRQPTERFQSFLDGWVDDLAQFHAS